MNNVRRIPVAQPFLGPEEVASVAKAMTDGAISGFFGEFIGLFENEFARYSDCAQGVAVNSGTTALHLALVTLGIKPGDEVLVSTLTNMATIFAILYIGACPVPIDIEADTLNLNPDLLDRCVTPKTRGILVVHLFGHPVDMDRVNEVARAHNLIVIEDCAEAHGALYRGRKVGSLSNAGCFSFYANKIITTGEGGMVTFNDPGAALRARNLKGLAFGDDNKFMHQDIGYNYRMTNIQAAIGHAQLAKIEPIIARKRTIAELYSKHLEEVADIQIPVEKPYARNVFWMYHIVLRGRHARRRREVMDRLAECGVETRETFIPCNLQRIFIDQGWTRADSCPLANEVAYAGFYMPSGCATSDEDLVFAAEQLIHILESPR